ILKEAVACLAHRPDDVGTKAKRARIAADRIGDRMRGAIEGGAKKIIHRGVHNDKILATVVLPIEHARQQDTRRTDEDPAWLEQEMTTERPHDSGHSAGIPSQVGRLLPCIADAEAAAKIENLERNTGARELANISRQALERLAKRPQAQDLRADVGANPS